MKAMNLASSIQNPRSAESVNRRSKDIILKRSDSRDPVKKPPKIVGKSLNSAFLAVSEDLPLETKEIVDSSMESDLLTETWLAESVLLSPDPVLTISSAISGRTSLSSSFNFTEDKEEEEEEEMIVDCNGSEKFDNLNTKNIDGQIFLDFLQEARFQVSHTSDINLRSKKILDAVINILIEDLSVLPEDKNEVTTLASEKVRIGFFCFLLWIFTVSVIFLFLNLRARSSFLGSPLT